MRAIAGAQYVCELVALSPEGDELVGTGVLRGEIALGAAGGEGFGFDPIFIPLGESAHRRGARRHLEGEALTPRARAHGRSGRRSTRLDTPTGL